MGYTSKYAQDNLSQHGDGRDKPQKKTEGTIHTRRNKPVMEDVRELRAARKEMRESRQERKMDKLKHKHQKSVAKTKIAKQKALKRSYNKM